MWCGGGGALFLGVFQIEYKRRRSSRRGTGILEGIDPTTKLRTFTQTEVVEGGREVPSLPRVVYTFYLSNLHDGNGIVELLLCTHPPPAHFDHKSPFYRAVWILLPVV